MKRPNAFLFFAVCIAFSMQAQSTGPVSAVIQTNNVKAVIKSNGILFNDGQEGQFVPIQPGLAQKTLLRGSGVWVAGIDPAGNLKGSVTVNGQTDFTPGFINFDTGASLDSLNNVWRVTCADINQHLADFNDNGVIDNPNAHVYGFPARGNGFFQAYNNGVMLPYFPQPMAGFFDADDTGLYEPQHGDYPTAQLRGCPLKYYPKEQDWFVCNDLSAHPSGLTPLNLEVQTQVLTFQTASPSLYNNAVYVRYMFINWGTERLDSCYIGVFSNFDIGNPDDDFIGTIPDKSIVYAYNGDTNDAGGFGTEIPVMAMDVMRGPLDTTGYEVPLRHLMALGNVANLQPFQYYNLLSGHFEDGSPAPNNGVMFQDNPNIPNGDSEQAGGDPPGERAGLASYGPFSLLPGAVNELVVGYYYTHTPGATPLQNVQQLYNESDIIQALFDNCFDIQDKNCDGLVPVFEQPAIQSGLSVFPNPATVSCTIKSSGAAFARIDMTDALGRQVRSIRLDNPVQEYILQTGGLPNGVYFLRVEGESRSVVVQR